MWETQIECLDWEDPLEKGMAIHSSILAWRIPWTEEPGGLQSMGSQRVRHDWANNTLTTLWAFPILKTKVLLSSHFRSKDTEKLNKLRLDLLLSRNQLPDKYVRRNKWASHFAGELIVWKFWPWTSERGRQEQASQGVPSASLPRQAPGSSSVEHRTHSWTWRILDLQEKWTEDRRRKPENKDTPQVKGKTDPFKNGNSVVHTLPASPRQGLLKPQAKCWQDSSEPRSKLGSTTWLKPSTCDYTFRRPLSSREPFLLGTRSLSPHPQGHLYYPCTPSAAITFLLNPETFIQRMNDKPHLSWRSKQLPGSHVPRKKRPLRPVRNI